MFNVRSFLIIMALSVLLSACNNRADKTKENETASTHSMHNMQSTSSGYADSVNNGAIAEDTLKGSPQRTAMATVGKTHVHITYHSPGVKDRVIWGGLVPYDKVWVTGAHTATALELNNPIAIGNKKIEAGTYAIFTIPGKNEWTFILNRNYQQHLADNYNEAEDVLRFVVKPEENKITQRLTYTVNKISDDTGIISMQWEKLKIEIPFKTVQ